MNTWLCSNLNDSTYLEHATKKAAEWDGKVRTETDRDFGGCPICGHYDGHLNIGRLNFALCLVHRAVWRMGENVCPCWREENEEIWDANGKMLEKSYMDVTS